MYCILTQFYEYIVLVSQEVEAHNLSSWLHEKKTILLTGLLCVPRHRAWYYMKFLHLWTGGELFKINFEFKWKQPVTKGSSANNFIMLNRSWSLSKNCFTSPILPNTNGQYQAAWNVNHKF